MRTETTKDRPLYPAKHLANIIALDCAAASERSQFADAHLLAKGCEGVPHQGCCEQTVGGSAATAASVGALERSLRPSLDS
jgi:hypothetical protein